jgi:peptidyl-prolyl cis-trans isomerase SurA
MKFKLLLVSLILLLSTLPATAKTISRIAAVVNSDIVTTYELDKAVNTALQTLPDSASLSAEQLDSLKKSTLDRLINNQLFAQRIAELQITVSDTDIAMAFANVQQQNNMTEEQLTQALSAQGISLDSYRENLKQEILNYKLISHEVYSKVLITSADSRQYFEEHLEDYQISATLDLNHISIDLNDTNRQSAEEQLDRARKLLLKGSDAAAVLATLKDSDLSGGPMNDMRESDLAQAIRAQLKTLDVGDVSEALELSGQLHLFQLNSRKTDQEAIFEKVKADITDTLQKQNSETRLKTWHQELRENADIDIRI